MFLARIDGTLTASRKDERLAGVRFLIGQRLNQDGTEVGEPLVFLDRMGAGRRSIVLVSSDGTIARDWLGKGVAARLVVVGIVDRVTPPRSGEEPAS
jgi:ethanolamine utilization protein EutN